MFQLFVVDYVNKFLFFYFNFLFRHEYAIDVSNEVTKS